MPRWSWLPRTGRRTAAAPEDETLVFAGSASPRLAAAICRDLEVEPGRGEVLRFSEGTLFVRVLQNVRGRRVYLVQSTVFPANDHLMELLFWIDALKRASAESVTAVIPYFSYGKGDKKDEPRVSIRARVCADAIESAGADRVVTMDLHAPQIQGFFRAPVDDLYAVDRLCAALRRSLPERPVVVSPDAGFAKKARAFADRLDAPMAIAAKTRAGHEERIERASLIGDVSGRDAILVDDFTVSGATLVEAAEELRRRGARTVIAAITHAVFAPGTAARLEVSPIERILVTDTVETQPEPLGSRVEVVSVAPLFAEAIRRIHRRESISSLFTAD
jgi:ribose-phosphate pyrophosphokinase